MIRNISRPRAGTYRFVIRITVRPDTWTATVRGFKQIMTIQSAASMRPPAGPPPRTAAASDQRIPDRERTAIRAHPGDSVLAGLVAPLKSPMATLAVRNVWSLALAVPTCGSILEMRWLRALVLGVISGRQTNCNV